MTTRELIVALGANPQGWGVALALVPLLALVLGALHPTGQGHRSRWRHLYAVLVYAACVPGIGAVLLCGYTLAFTRENLLDANALVYLAPMLVMVATLALVGRQADFVSLPGVDRLAGLVIMLALTGICLYGIAQTRVLLIFHGGPMLLAVVAVGLFLGFKFGARMLFGKKA
ncbi:MAG: hypothetical protein JWM80_3187 [Cyanobacteria bacterium RYN_339]|nr:hypothetical protein [Cyanobacteria bacterium RYN_339]